MTGAPFPFSDLLAVSGAALELLWWPGTRLLGLAGQTTLLLALLYAIHRGLDHWWPRAFGWRGFLTFTAAGTVVHELGHALAAMVLGHRLRRCHLFRPDRPSGYLGRIDHEPPRPRWRSARRLSDTIWRIAIPLAPLPMGMAALAAATHLLGPGALHRTLNTLTDAGTAAERFGNLFSPAPLAEALTAMLSLLGDPALWSDWRWYPLLYLTASLVSALFPSEEDWRTLRPALPALAVLFWVGSILSGAVAGGGMMAAVPLDRFGALAGAVLPRLNAILVLAGMIGAAALLFAVVVRIARSGSGAVRFHQPLHQVQTDVEG